MPRTARSARSKRSWVPHDTRDQVVDYVRYWQQRTELVLVQSEMEGCTQGATILPEQYRCLWYVVPEIEIYQKNPHSGYLVGMDFLSPFR